MKFKAKNFLCPLFVLKSPVVYCLDEKCKMEINEMIGML
jgi:hypothetical protein